MEKLKRASLLPYLILRRNKFFYVVVFIFCLQALWIAFSNRYPMAFDEEYHFGLIKLYAEHGLPVWSGQPAGADSFGAVHRDPSYIFHYVFSFIYKFIRLFTDNQAFSILSLRLINIA